MNAATEAHCHWRWSHNALEVYLIGSAIDGDFKTNQFGFVKTLGRPVEFGQMSEAHPSQPTFTLTPESAQQFMDSLWQAGMRPTEGTGSAGSLAATEKHLKDMRAIVSKQLEVNLDAVQR